MWNRRAFLAAPVAGFISGCKRVPKLKVGGKAGVEGVLLCEIISQLLERRLKAEVERRLNITGPTAVYQAFQNGDVDVYTEYTRVAFKVLIKMTVTDESSINKLMSADEYMQLVS